MTARLPLLDEQELCAPAPSDESGFGALHSAKGSLPLKAMDVDGRVDGLLAQLSVQQTFVNTHDEPIEATYIFPLPDRAAVTQFRMQVGSRVVEGTLKERGKARHDYDQAIAAGHRASIAEEERPGVFTLRVGNLMPGDEAVISLVLAGPLPYCDGEVTLRFPLVVAPRYIPGVPLSGPSVGEGTASDTDAVPDASRITPPVLLPGYPNPVRLRIAVAVHGCGLPVTDLRSSLHTVVNEQTDGVQHVVVEPGERLNRDFILRFRLGATAVTTALSLHPDPGSENRSAGTFALTIIPPTGTASRPRPRDIAFVIDRSGSMEGWKIVAARRAMARMIDALNDHDRFTLLAFDSQVEMPAGHPGKSLVPATDRERFRAVEFLAHVEARGGTEMAEPLDRASTLLADCSAERERVLVLVTDGQVGNEDQLLRLLGARLKGMRVFTLGIDTAVNEGFLKRLAALGDGACELVESEDRLDTVMNAIHRRIGAPVLRDLGIESGQLQILRQETVPSRLGDLFAGAPLLVLGRYEGAPGGSLVARGVDATGEPWSETVQATVRDNPAIAAAWARGRIRELEDRYVIGEDHEALEQEIIRLSLAYGVLCRFTAYLAVDSEQVVNEGGHVQAVVQPVELPQGWAGRVLAGRVRGGMGGYAARLSVEARGMSAPSALEAESCDSYLMCFDMDDAGSGIFNAPSAPAPAPPEQSGPPSQSMPIQARPKKLPKTDWGRLVSAFGFGSASRGELPPSLDLPAYRRLVDAILARLVDVITGTAQGRARNLRILTRQLRELTDAMKGRGAPAEEIKALDALYAELEAVAKRRRVADDQWSALRDQVEQTRKGLAASDLAAPPRSGQRSGGFWK
jgi:Ca-activated chloride channel family protein